MNHSITPQLHCDYCGSPERSPRAQAGQPCRMASGVPSELTADPGANCSGTLRVVEKRGEAA